MFSRNLNVKRLQCLCNYYAINIILTLEGKGQ